MALIKNLAGPDDNMTCLLKQVNDQCDAILNRNDSYTIVKLIFTDPCFLILALFSIVIGYCWYKIYVNPVSYVKELSQVGFEHIPPGPDRDLRIARAQSMRRIGKKLPPPYPNGWFAVADTNKLKVGGVLAVDCLGQNLCVYRGEDGKARVVDAYCPHLGANLGVGGSVHGNCIECPFHHWQFDAEGVCKYVPGTEHVPKGVAVKTWPCVEAEGAVWIWHDAEGRAPLWTMEEAPECKVWGYRGSNDYTISAHIQDIPENGADIAHLNAVHLASLFFRMGYHTWNAKWSSNNDHTASITLTHDYKLGRFNIGHVDLQITQVGPGHVRLLMMTTAGPFLISQSVTPLGPMLQRIVHRMYSPVHNGPFAWILNISEAKMIERDIRIWNNKSFVSAPAYVKADKTIRSFRTWFSQFYTEHSISFRQSIQHPLDW